MVGVFSEAFGAKSLPQFFKMSKIRNWLVFYDVIKL